MQMGRKQAKERRQFPCSENESITSQEPGASRRRKKPEEAPWSLGGQHDLANLLLWGFWPQEYENKLPLLKVTYVTAIPGIRYTLSLWLKVRRKGARKCFGRQQGL